MVSLHTLLQILVDGKYHSGATLGQVLGVSRAAVWKMIQKMEDTLGLTVYAVKGKGYRLQHPVELLDKKVILDNLSNKTVSQLNELDILFDVDSTNRYLSHKSIDGAASAYLVIAEQQTRGQGRRGRAWVSPFGGNLYLSLLWRFQFGPAQLACLGMVVAVAVIRALNKIGIKDAGVKWPNDIIWQGKKLAGILLEMRGEATGPSAIVIGIGINISMRRNDKNLIDEIDQPWIDIESILKSKIARNQFAAYVIEALFSVLNVFPEQQIEMLKEWQQMDILKNQEVEVIFPDNVIHGVAQGINQDGALRVLHQGKEMICHSGEVSIRRGN